MAQTELIPVAFESYTVRDFLPSVPENEENINQIIRWSVRESMVAISPASIRSHNFAKAAFTVNDETILGYGAVTHIYSSQIVELGGLVVHEATRGMGIASKIIKSVVSHTLETMKPLQVIAFSNTESAGIFTKLGGKQVEDALSLPSEVWKVCHTCKYYDEALARDEGCCGRVYDITNIDVGDK